MSIPSTGKDVREFRSRDDAEKRQHEYRRILLPYLVLIGSQLPLVYVYLSGLMSERPHYGLWPAAIIGCIFFLVWRWPRFGEPVFFNSTKSDVLLVLGVLCGLPAALLLSPWFGFAAFILLFGSLLARINDRHVFGTLLATIAPLVVILQPPLAIDFDTVQGDIEFTAWLNNGSTKVASDILDLMQYPHNIADHRMEFPIREFSSIHLGNSSLSVFTLLIITALFIAWQRMPMFRSAMLLTAASFWFMTFEAIEIVICVIAESSFENDYYSPGSGNRLVQILGLLAAGLMTLLSDRMIAFLFGPVDIQAIDENISYQDILCRFWNSAIAGVSSPEIDPNVKKELAWAKRRNSLPGGTTITAIWAAAILMALSIILQLAGLGSALSRSGSSVLENNNNGLASENLVKVGNGLQISEFQLKTPEHDSLFEANLHRWEFSNESGQRFLVEISYPYSGWHDFDREIRSRDWKPQDDPQMREFSVGDTTIPVVSRNYRNSLAEYRTAFNAQIDGFGEGFEVPLTWRSPGAFFGRAISRLGNRSRPRVFSGLSIQINVHVDTIGPNPEPAVQQAETLLEAVVTEVQASISDGSFGTASGAEAN